MKTKQQMKLMMFDPATKEAKPYPSQADQWREWHGRTAWIYDPWTGVMRAPEDIGSDTFGHLIIPPGEKIKAGK